MNINAGFADFKIDDDLFSFEMDDLNLEHNDIRQFETRILKPIAIKELKEKYVNYEYAKDLAKVVSLMPNERIYAIVNGTFVFGDFIEALLVEKQIIVDEMTISTLSLNANNIDSLYNLMESGYIKKLNLILSIYFYGHERHGLIEYLYDKLDIDNRLQVAITAVHTKIIIFKTGIHNIVIHGSANLRSSANVEQIMIENNKELYDFNDILFTQVLNKFKTINHQIIKGNVWQAVQKVVAVAPPSQKQKTENLTSQNQK